MVTRCSLLIVLVLSAGLGTLAGCRTPSQQVQTMDDSGDTGPAPPAARDGGRGLLLRTGAIQLGPGVQRNLWRWQGDGEGGF
jgi:hypothetical protein